MTNKSFGYKLRVVQRARFEYSPLGKVFYKGSEKDEKKGELLQRLKKMKTRMKRSWKQLKKESKTKIVYLKLEINKFFKIYPGSFLKNSRSALKNLAKN